MTLEEGIQPDFSFHQHGPCLYSHGYGAGFAGDGARIAALLAGTRFAFPQEKIDLLAALVLDGHQWFARGAHQDFGAIGRELARPGHTAAFLRPVAQNLLRLPTGREAELRALTARLEDSEAPPLVGSRHFYRSDITAHHRPGFYASARAFSDRLANTDHPCNDEALKSHHIADGATCILRHGREYLDLFPVWDWHRIPGTTVVQTPRLTGEVRRQGSRAFGGGVSDGRHSLAAFDLERDGLEARKCWFFCDDGIVCLGAGIAAPHAHPVATTVQQCRLQGDVYSASGPLALGDHELEGVEWVYHDGTAYIFPEPAAVRLSARTRSGSWHQISHSLPDEPVQAPVFALWIDHGVRPQHASYAYIVLPGTERGTVRQGDRPDIEILANEPRVQAADITAAVAAG